MRALTILQPWTSLIVGWTDDAGASHSGPKGIENRSWVPPDEVFGQRIAIHAGKREDDGVGASLLGAKYIFNAGGSEFTANAPDYPGRTAELPRAAVIGVATLLGIIIARGGPIRTFGLPLGALAGEDLDTWFTGEVGLVLGDRIALPEPVPCKGALGFWRLPTDVEARVRAQLPEVRHG